MRTKILAFALSGFMAGYAGVCLAFADQRISVNTFAPAVSILVISMVVIGGLGSIPGAVLGALYLVGLPAIFGTTPTIQFITSGIGLLAFILYLPGGLAELLQPLRRPRGRWDGSAWPRVRRRPIRTRTAAHPGRPPSPAEPDDLDRRARRCPGRRRGSTGEVSGPVPAARLEVDDVAVAFGGVRAARRRVADGRAGRRSSG